MSDIIVVAAESITDDPDDLAPTRRRTPGIDGGLVPGRLVGYTWDGACYCVECAPDVKIPYGGTTSPEAVEEHGADDDGNVLIPMPEYPADATDPNGFGVGVLSGFSESDYPGDSCHECHRRLQTKVLLYDQGPGAEVYAERSA